MAQDNPVEMFKTKYEKYFKPSWLKYTLRHGATKIAENQIMDFMYDLDEPLGFKLKNKKSSMNRGDAAKAVMQLDLHS